MIYSDIEGKELKELMIAMDMNDDDISPLLFPTSEMEFGI